MFTIRNMGGVALLLLGSTFVWLTPEFASKGADTSGFGWQVVRIGSLVTILGFTAATWGLFLKASWWEGAALASCALGALILVPYWVVAHRAGEPSPWWNVLIHAVGIAGVGVLLLVPRFEEWVSGHVTRGV